MSDSHASLDERRLDTIVVPARGTTSLFRLIHLERVQTLTLANALVGSYTVPDRVTQPNQTQAHFR
jgi:hypothetical protein